MALRHLQEPIGAESCVKGALGSSGCGADGHCHYAWGMLLDTAGLWAASGSASCSQAHCGILGMLRMCGGSEG